MDLVKAAPWPADVTLVVLTGGSSRRLGRDKATTHIGGRRLLDRLLDAVPSDVPVVIVGPAVAGLPARVTVVREEPAGAGPLAGIGAGVAAARTSLVGVLAADMPFALPVLGAALRLLASSADPVGAQESDEVRDASVWTSTHAADSVHPAAAVGSLDAVIPVDPEGHQQPLCAAYRTAALRDRLTDLAPLAHRPVRGLLTGLRVMEWPVPADALADVDTADQLQAARARAAEEVTQMQEWLAAVQAALGVDIAVDVDTILDVARDAAHSVDRPAAPVTTFLLGVAIARGADPAEAAATVSRLAAEWASRPA